MRSRSSRTPEFAGLVRPTPLTHFFRQANGEVGESRTFTAVGSASGLGDIMVRLKGGLRLLQFQALDGRSTFASIGFARDSFNALSGAIGLKANVAGRLLLDVNLLFKLDEHGLRDKVTPLIGVECSF